MGSLTLDKIRSDASGAVYPCDLLDQCETALVLFAAGFHGRQDAVWIADADIEADCVDLDEKRLNEMAAVYPASWRFTPMDAFEFVQAAKEKWDIVSVDCPTNLFDRCAKAGQWCRRARKAVVLGVGVDTHVEVPAGWQLTDIRKRSGFQGGVYWAVLERA